jgi:hypothetical protein
LKKNNFASLDYFISTNGIRIKTSSSFFKKATTESNSIVAFLLYYHDTD